MVMLDTQTLIQVKSCLNFKTQSHKLYNDLNYSTLADAEQDILHHFCNVRLKKLNLKEFKAIWNNNTNEYDGKAKNRKWLEYNITYSRQDLIRLHQKQKDKKHETLESLKFNYCPTYTVDDKETNQESPLNREKQLVLANLNLLFQRSPKKREYIQHTLGGNSDDFQFSPSMNEQLMLRSISQYCDQHRKDFDKVLNRELSNKDRKTLSFINTFLTIEDADNVTLFQKQGKQAEIINQSKANKALFEYLVGNCGEGKSHYITHQVALLNSWEKVEYQTEKSYLVQYLRIKKEQLENKLR